MEYGGLTDVETGVVSELEDKLVFGVRPKWRHDYPAILTQPRSQHPLTPHIPPSPRRHLKFRFSLLYSTAEEGHCDPVEIFIFVLFHIYMS